jgi:hypothetical protein
MGLHSDIAAAVAAALNAETWPIEFTAVVPPKGVPRYDVEELAALHVTVIERGASGTYLSRKKVQEEYGVDVCVQQRPVTEAGQPDLTAARIAALESLVDAIRDFLLGRRLASPDALCVLWEIPGDRPFLDEHMSKDHVFTSAVTFTYRLARDK